MTENIIIYFLFFSSFLLWVINIVAQILKLTYVLQLKEYRWDRICDFLKSPEGRRFVFTPFFYAYLLFIFILVFLVVFSLVSSIPAILFPLCVFLFYCSGFFIIIKKLRLHTLHRPHWTKKSLLLVSFSLLMMFLSPPIFDEELSLLHLLYDLMYSSWIVLFLSPFLLIYNFFVPFFVLFWFLILQVGTVFVKKYLYSKAEKKIRVLPHLTVIGITGSYGKSSTKEFLATILLKKFHVLATPANVNSEIGVAQIILKRLDPLYDIFIVEMGAYKKGEIALISKMTQPKIGILTAINEQHISLFGSIENIKNAKYELVESLPDDGFAIFNGDNEYCVELFNQTKKPKLLYSTRFTHLDNHAIMKNEVDTQDQSDTHRTMNKRKENNEAKQKVFEGAIQKTSNMYATDIRSTVDGIRCTVHKENDQHDFFIPVLGIHNVSNLLAAVAAASYLGMSLSEISEATRDIQPRKKTLMPLQGINGTLIIDDSYSANPDGVIAALEYIDSLAVTNSLKVAKKIMIMRGMIELGKKSAEAHKRVGKKAAEVCDLVIFTTTDFFSDFLAGAKQSASESKKNKISMVEKKAATFGDTDFFGDEIEENVLQISSPEKIIEKVKPYFSEGNIFLLENRIPSQIIRKLTC